MSHLKEINNQKIIESQNHLMEAHGCEYWINNQKIIESDIKTVNKIPSKPYDINNQKIIESKKS